MKKWMLLAALALSACASDPSHHMQGATSAQGVPGGDARELVSFPEPMRLHTIASMRDHLLALQEIDVALSRGDFEGASRIAEVRLGMSSLESHGAAHLAPFMPEAMQYAPRGEPLRGRGRGCECG